MVHVLTAVKTDQTPPSQGSFRRHRIYYATYQPPYVPFLFAFSTLLENFWKHLMYFLDY